MTGSERERRRGLFIVLEGLDGAGTTTQSERLMEWFRGAAQPCVRTCEPTDLPVGVLLRQVLRGEMGGARTKEVDPGAVALLFAADRLDHLSTRVVPALERGENVISDRYVYSSLAYQGSLLPIEWVETINKRALVPDLTLYVRVSVSTAMSRLGARSDVRDIYEREPMLASVRNGYEEMVRGNKIPNLVVIDGEMSIEEVWAAIRSAVEIRTAQLK